MADKFMNGVRRRQVDKELEKQRAELMAQVENGAPSAAVLAEMWMTEIPRGEKFPIDEVIAAAHMVMLEALTRRHPRLEDQLLAVATVARRMAANLKMRSAVASALEQRVAELQKSGLTISKDEVIELMRKYVAEKERRDEVTVDNGSRN